MVASLGESVGQRRKSDTRGADAVNKQDFFSIFGTKLIDSHASILESRC